MLSDASHGGFRGNPLDPLPKVLSHRRPVRKLARPLLLPSPFMGEGPGVRVPRNRIIAGDRFPEGLHLVEATRRFEASLRATRVRPRGERADRVWRTPNLNSGWKLSPEKDHELKIG
jgi:hypothetical protein